MSEVEIHSEFDRRQCIALSLSEVSPFFVPSMTGRGYGPGFEKRFLGDQFLPSSEGSVNFRLHAATADAQQKLTDLWTQNDISALTDVQWEKVWVAENEVIRTTGGSFLREAERLCCPIEKITVAEAAERFWGGASGQNVKALAGLLTENAWRLFFDPGLNKWMLVLGGLRQINGATKVTTLVVDDVFEKDEDVVRRLIVEYYAAEAVLAALSQVRENMEIHSSVAEYLPELILRLGQRSEEEIKQMTGFLTRVVECGPWDALSWVSSYLDGLLNTVVSHQLALKHLRDCPGSREDQGAQNWLGIAEELKRLRRIDLLEGKNNQNLLSQPLDYTRFETKTAIVSAKTRLNRNNLVGEFFAKAVNLSVADFLAEMSEKLPDIAEKLEQFRGGWKGMDKIDLWEGILPEVVESLLFKIAANRNQPQVSVERLAEEAIDQELQRWSVFIRSNLPGLDYEETPTGTRVRIERPFFMPQDEFEAVLVWLTLKAAREQQAVVVGRQNIDFQNVQRKTLDSIDAAIAGMAKRYSNNVLYAQDVITNATKRSREMQAFLRVRGIKTGLVERLAESAVRWRAKGGESYSADWAYFLAFNALVASGEGDLNLAAPAVRVLLGDLGVPAEMIQALEEEV